MIFTVQVIIDENLIIDLFEVDIPREEMMNVSDAFNCEMKYCDFDVKL